MNHFVELAAQEKPDAVLISGDVYDRALPNPLTVQLLDETLFRLLETGTRVVLTSGNHDSAIRLGFGSRVFERQGLIIRTPLTNPAEPVPIPARQGEGLAGYVVPIPYLEPQVDGPRLGAAEATHAATLRRAVEIGMDAVKALPDAGSLPVVGMAHAFFAGATSSESERDIRVGGLGVAPVDVVTAFDYAALGHLHGAQTLTDSVRYSGSPVAMSFSEANHVKGCWLAEVTCEGVTAEFEPAPVYRRLSILRGELEELLTRDDLSVHEGDWCQVTLTDPIRPAHAIDRIRTRFPGTLQLQFELPPSSPERASYASRVQGRSDADLCCDFLEHVRGGRGPSASERESLEQAITYAQRAVNTVTQESR